MKKQMTAVILAGGASSRMGENKALIKLGNKTMIERVVEPLRPLFEEILIVTDTPEVYSFLGKVSFTDDLFETNYKSSLLGIYSGLKVAKYSSIFVFGCDMPFLNQALITYMQNQYQGEDLVIPYLKPYYEPLHAIFSKSCLPLIEKALVNKTYKIVSLISQLKVRKILKGEVLKFDPLMKCFYNVNTNEEYLEISKEF
ncbi:molybdenum cofactor guanylyltransferase [Alkaliphilus transvaalensis]|uniref:molybdenum cofactor guanylyltransferase n=1 Tax=Alkaliphilus transvaalensis TaxID=114628 RepID=UPI000555B703|nr:molybdenum cofactor guanylyltransferase [Alkaliphilus transvaalensis]